MVMEDEMPGIGDFELKEVGVIVFAGSDLNYDVENLHHGFLVARGVIPSDWEKVESELASFYSEISYGNGMSLDMDRKFIRANQDGDLEFGERNEPVEFMIRYLNSVEKNTLEGSMMRWVLVAPRNNPEEWIGKRVIHPRVIEGNWDALRSQISFHVDIQGLGLSFSLSAQNIESDTGEEQETVSIICGVRKEAFGDNDELIGWLSGWRKQEAFMLDTLESLLGVVND